MSVLIVWQFFVYCCCFVDAANLLRRMSRLLEDNEGSLVAARADREERSFNQTLREEQDQAYLESLQADQEKVISRHFIMTFFCYWVKCWYRNDLPY